MSYVYIYVFAFCSVPFIIDGANFPALYSSSLITMTATPLIQTFVSHPGYDGHIRYPDGNYTQDWYIRTNWINHTIKINFATCFIENSKGVCLFDYLFVFDGANSSSPEMMKTCCGKTHSATLESSAGEMYILFETDNTVGDTGFEIEYWSNGITTTTSTTTVAPFTVDVSDQETGLTKGEIAGIVVGCIASVALIAVICCIVILKFIFSK
ncbi:deleted in malignant brain tumors 1 protein-like isoform X2 [Mytilus californianus]|uniref:deleted in malignant brain tumors 1 protein-like isoform X2 n=1 Tax=Mytilus californianus TaxID=6549 RepID=UPI0022483911|nr:deleted in malignant brain tumors 1 protein-like isoform X2 [Mytilus californianus]